MMEGLQIRAGQLNVQLATHRERAAAAWLSAERSSLEAQAVSLKESLQILAREQNSFSIGAPQTQARAFQPFQSTLSAGKTATLPELRHERDRLHEAMQQVDHQIAEAKAEVLQQRREQDTEVWETQLVALQVNNTDTIALAPPRESIGSQDTKRVYLDEIHLLEAELLGREQLLQLQQEREAAEASGATEVR